MVGNHIPYYGENAKGEPLIVFYFQLIHNQASRMSSSGVQYQENYPVSLGLLIHYP